MNLDTTRFAAEPQLLPLFVIGWIRKPFWTYKKDKVGIKLDLSKSSSPNPQKYMDRLEMCQFQK